MERVLRLPQEAWAQSLALGSPDLVQLANKYYAWVHFPAAAAMLLGLWFFAHGHYFWVRRVMATMTMVALVLHVVLPLAPPRMLPGFVDTGLYYNESVYSSPTATALANQYAAMPSLHVGWAIIVAAAVMATIRSRWRYLILAHPAITLIVVVVTANHYWLDALVAGALFVVSFALVGPRGVLLRSRQEYAVAA
nr:phosphatase PAP2 family protein [Motilibacter aurantiacus]